MTEINALIFDKDGTLFDFAATWEDWATSFLLRACDGDHGRAQTVGDCIGYDLANRKFAPDSVVIAGTPGEIVAVLQPLFPAMSQKALITLLNDEAEQAQQYEAVPLVPLFEQLRNRGMRLGIATNDAERPARAHLGQAGVTEFFDFIAGYDSGHGGKPAPGQLLAFASHINIPPAQIAMVGDSSHDLEAGRAAGMTTIGVLTGMADRTALNPLADVVLPDIGGIPDWLAQRRH